MSDEDITSDYYDEEHNSVSIDTPTERVISKKKPSKDSFVTDDEFKEHSPIKNKNN